MLILKIGLNNEKNISKERAEFGLLIRKARIEKNLTQVMLYDLIKTGKDIKDRKTMISKLETGVIVCRKDRLIKLLEFFGLPLDTVSPDKKKTGVRKGTVRNIKPRRNYRVSFMKEININDLKVYNTGENWGITLEV